MNKDDKFTWKPNHIKKESSRIPKLKEMIKNVDEDHKPGHDHEGKMAKSQLERSMKYAKMIYNMIDNVGKGGEVEMPSWVQSYLTKSQDYLQTVFNYLDGKDGLEDKFQ